MNNKLEAHLSLYRSPGHSYNLCSSKSRFSEKIFYSFHIKYGNLKTNKIGLLVLSYRRNSKSYNKSVAMDYCKLRVKNETI